METHKHRIYQNNIDKYYIIYAYDLYIYDIYIRITNTSATTYLNKKNTQASTDKQTRKQSQM